MKRSVPRGPAGYAAAVLVALFICASSHHACAEPLRSPLHGATAETSLPQPPGSQIRAYADPQTGELTAPPELGDALPPRPTSKRSAGELEILPGQTPAGGVMVDLRGHFALGLRATAAKDGRVTTGCEPRNAPTTAE